MGWWFGRLLDSLTVCGTHGQVPVCSGAASSGNASPGLRPPSRNSYAGLRPLRPRIAESRHESIRNGSSCYTASLYDGPDFSKVTKENQGPHEVPGDYGRRTPSTNRESSVRLVDLSDGPILGCKHSLSLGLDDEDGSGVSTADASDPATALRASSGRQVLRSFPEVPADAASAAPEEPWAIRFASLTATGAAVRKVSMTSRTATSTQNGYGATRSAAW
jgi:hypothetical protein